MMLRSAKASFVVRRTSSHCHSCLPSSSAASAATSALKTTQRAYLNARAKSTSAATESATHPSRPFNVSSEDQVQPSANTRPNETDESLIGKTGGESSNNTIPKNINGVSGVSESVEGHVANTAFRLLSPQVRARSITDRQAWLARINAQKTQLPFSD
ncbi:uncharacterized protein TrAFT101_000051 [Trichoderma asperellum]|uniref:uncharacterized protein n=1 Tax=Trichoderma asperellum TaxID=101201 RepID=UPI0033213BFE|nr:hypothetical protein TrAFT101_000051 [Trichoderma asperellum]